MNIRRAFYGAAVILLCLAVYRLVRIPAATSEREPAEADADGARASALVARMRGVTMLEFRTDRRLHEIRVMVNEGVIGSLTMAAEDNQRTLKLAVVISGSHKSASVFLNTPNYGGDFVAAYPPSRHPSDPRPSEYCGPGRDIKLPLFGWMEVYRLSEERNGSGQAPYYELKVEIR
jgi:hypothetical protein